jgi:hypothetical protein
MENVSPSIKENNRAYKTAISPVIREATQKGMACKKLFLICSFLMLSNTLLTFPRSQLNIFIHNYFEYAKTGGLSAKPK